MIIEQPYKANDTITIRTNTGEEVVARFVQEDRDTLSITKPLVLQGDSKGIGLGPWCFTVDPKNTVKLNKNSILFTHKTEPSMASQYMLSLIHI